MQRGAGAISIAARPEPFALDLGQVAVLVVDMQNDFGARGGMFERAGIDIAPIRRALPPTARVLAAARRAGMPVIYLQMQHKPDLSDAGAEQSPHRIKAPPPGGRRGGDRPGWQPEPHPGRGQLEHRHPGGAGPAARRPGGAEAPLQRLLRDAARSAPARARHRATRGHGCTTSVCVESTIRDAMFRDYQCLLLEDCTAEPIGQGLPSSNHEPSLLTIQLVFGWESDSGRLLEALG